MKNNVNDALVEALTSMAVSQPDDPIEFLGKYLLNWVDRKTIQAKVLFRSCSLIY